MTPQQLTEEDVRLIVREELNEAARRIVSGQSAQRARLVAGVDVRCNRTSGCKETSDGDGDL